MNKIPIFRKIRQVMLLVCICSLMSACVGTVVGVAVDTAIEVAKVPFKVGAAVIDVATPDRSDKKKRSNSNQSKDD